MLHPLLCPRLTRSGDDPELWAFVARHLLRLGSDNPDREDGEQHCRHEPHVDEEPLGEGEAPDVGGPEGVDDRCQVERERRCAYRVGDKDRAE